MKLCEDPNCEPLCDFCKNFDNKDWVCKVSGLECDPTDCCYDAFVCFRS